MRTIGKVTLAAGAALLVFALSGCSSDQTPLAVPSSPRPASTSAVPKPIKHPTSALAEKRRAKEHQQMLAYLRSDQRKAQLDKAFNQNSVRLARALSNGTFGKIEKYQWDGTPGIPPNFTGKGTVTTVLTHARATATSGRVYVHLYWKKGEIDYSRGVLGLFVQATPTLEGMAIFRSNDVVPFDEVYVVSTSGILYAADEVDSYGRFKGEVHYITTAEAKALDERAHKVLVKRLKAAHVL